MSGYPLLDRNFARLLVVSNYSVKTRLITVWLCSIVVSLSVFGQQSKKPNVRISCPLLNAHPLRIIRPAYPALARQTHVEGRVSLDCFIGTDGLVKNIEVKKGHPLLIQAATDAVSRWTFKPVMLNGKAVEVETIVNIDFQLPKDQKDTAGKTPA